MLQETGSLEGGGGSCLVKSDKTKDLIAAYKHIGGSTGKENSCYAEGQHLHKNKRVWTGHEYICEYDYGIWCL